MWNIKAKIANSSSEFQTFEVKKEKEDFFLQEEMFQGDILELKDGSFHIIFKNKSYLVEVVEEDYPEKKFIVEVNGTKYELEAQDRMDLLLKKLGMDHVSNHQISDLKAPMPGLILDIKVALNQEVKKGDVLVVLEAMKMENVLKAPVDSIIKSIPVKKGINVEKNQVLIQFG